MCCGDSQSNDDDDEFAGVSAKDLALVQESIADEFELLLSMIEVLTDLVVPVVSLQQLYHFDFDNSINESWFTDDLELNTLMNLNKK